MQRGSCDCRPPLLKASVSNVINIKLREKKGFLITLCPASACLSVNSFFVITFSGFYPKLVGGYQPNLAQNILGEGNSSLLAIRVTPVHGEI